MRPARARLRRARITVSKQGPPRRPLDEAVLTIWETRAASRAAFASAASKPATHRGQDDQFNCLAILAIFVKQRTYLATLLLFGHLALYLATLLFIWSPCPVAPRLREIRERRNVTSSVRRPSLKGLSSLTSLSSHISTGNTTKALPPREPLLVVAQDFFHPLLGNGEVILVLLQPGMVVVFNGRGPTSVDLSRGIFLLL